MRMRPAVSVVAVLTFLGAPMTPATAQMPGGAYERLSQQDQRFARSLFTAQRRSLPPGGRLTLDQIAARKHGASWGIVVRQMKSEGLVTANGVARLFDTAQPGSATRRYQGRKTDEHTGLEAEPRQGAVRYAERWEVRP